VGGVTGFGRSLSSGAQARDQVARNDDQPAIERGSRTAHCRRLRPCQMDCGAEISGGFVVACRDSAELLEFAEEVLNEMTRLESRFVIGTLVSAIAPGWDHGSFSRCAKRVDHTLVGVECFVCQQSVGLHPRQQRVGAFQIMGFARGQKEGEWIAQGVNQGVDFGAQPAMAGPDRLHALHMTVCVKPVARSNHRVAPMRA